MKTQLRQQARLSAIAVAVLIAGMLGLVPSLWHASSKLAMAATEIAVDDAPSMVALESASSDLRELQVRLRDRVRGTPDELALREVEIGAHRRALGEDIQSYLSAAVDPGEGQLRAEIESDLGGIDLVMQHLGEQRSGPRANEADVERALDTAVSRLDAALRRASKFNAENLVLMSQSIQSIRRRWVPFGLALDAVNDALAIAFVLLAYRAMRRASQIATEHRAALERKADELEQFAGRVAHDLLTPLTGVGLAAGLVERKLVASEPEAARAALLRVTSGLERVHRMVEGLFDFARSGASPPPGVSAKVEQVVEDVADAFRPVAAEAGVELRVEPIPACAVRCSAGVLTSLLSNLLQNAIKHLGASEARSVVVRVLDEGTEVRAEVEDSGPGIPAGLEEAIFKPYVRGPQAVAPGLGLGLATVKRFAESHGGRAGVRPAAARGSIFWFSLPKAE